MCVFGCVRRRSMLSGQERENQLGGGYHLPFTGVGYIPSVAAAVRAAAPSAPVLVAPVRVPLPPIDGWDLPSIRSSTGGGARCYKCVVPRCVFFLGQG